MSSIKTLQEIARMRNGGQKLARVMRSLQEEIRLGISTGELDKKAGEFIKREGAEIAFRGYQGFPRNICISLNEEVVHGVPADDRFLKEGDLVTLDIGLMWDGLYADMARTFSMPGASPEAVRLSRITKKALKLGIKKARVGNTVGDIGNTIQRFVEQQGYAVVQNLCGHGIGRELHEEPQVLNYGKRHTEERLRVGMVLCIEPMVVMGSGEKSVAALLQEGSQTFVSPPGTLSAHFEDMVAILEDGPEVLTKDE
ncbi:MAG: type I methionyl aminopeptidase [Patescibacteria group bacterium]